MKHIVNNRLNRILAFILTFALIAGAMLPMSTALAAPSDINVTLSQPNEYRVIEKGTTYQIEAGGIKSFDVSNTNATAAFNAAKLRVLVTGVNAGVVTIAASSSGGYTSAFNYQITDSSKISAYRIKEGGEVVFGNAGATKASPVTVTAGTNNISWSSLQPSIATVNASTGAITAVSKGAAIIIGKFTDKWGVEQDIHILVGVGVNLSDTDLGRLIELINKGESILAVNPSPYDADSLAVLQSAVDGGKDVLDMNNPSTSVINKAIDDLENALAGLELSGAPDVIKGDDGNYYRPVGDPPYIYEIVDKNGRPTSNPPKYVYNKDGKPGNGNDRPAYLKDGKYYVEDPAGGNIFKPVGPDGELKDDGAVWGGEDKTFDTNDDKPAVKDSASGKWYINYGQNVYQELNTTAPIGSAARGQPTGKPFGAGADAKPGTDDDLPLIYLHKDGKYYSGPYTDTDGSVYFIGDKPSGSGGNGMLNTSGNGLGGHAAIDSTDQKYYLVNGEMVTEKPAQPATVASVAVTPNNITIAKGSSAQFTAAVTGTNNPPQDVVWTVEGNTNSGTAISLTGELTVALGETASKLTVRATSAVDSSKSGTANVDLADPSVQLINAASNKIATGLSSFIIKDNGTLWATGYNYYGQLGLGDNKDRKVYTKIASLAGLSVAAVADGPYHTAALTTDGRIFTWGSNTHGQLGDNTTVARYTPYEVKIPGVNKFKAVDANYYSTAAITEDGELYVWGCNLYGQSSHEPITMQKTPHLVSMGAIGTKIKAVTLGHQCVYALTENDDLYSWGLNDYGQLGNGTKTTTRYPTKISVGYTGTKTKAIWAGSSRVTLLTESGDIYTWGHNGYGELGDGTTTTRYNPVKVMNGSVKFAAVAGGYDHSMALDTEGRLYMWGKNSHGQFGDGTTANKLTPVCVTPDITYKAISAGVNTSMAVRTDGRLYMCGSNTYGQFGNGLAYYGVSSPLYIPLD